MVVHKLGQLYESQTQRSTSHQLELLQNATTAKIKIKYNLSTTELTFVRLLNSTANSVALSQILLFATWRISLILQTRKTESMDCMAK